MKCRHCKKLVSNLFLDLGFAPLSNSYLTKENLKLPEMYLPLRIKVCDKCWLVQTEDYIDKKNIFKNDYAYFSSTSKTWLAHAKYFVKKITKELQLSSQSHVVEIASNDGYLLKNFIDMKIPCLGIEPTKGTAHEAENLKIPVIKKFFSEKLAKQLADNNKKADLIIGNNVFAHVPNINDFTRGLKVLLKPKGTITLEFPHLMKLIDNLQFDTIYHEHFSYLSLLTVNRIFKSFGLKIYNVEEIVTHGGSIRIYGCHENETRRINVSVNKILNREYNKGLNKLDTYKNFQNKIDLVKNKLLSFLINQKNKGKKVVAYGAAAKGNTLLNYAGIKSDLLPYVYDLAKSKHGKFMPGSHIPILPSKEIINAKPDFVLILPRNISKEVKLQNSTILKKRTKFVVAIPHLKIL
jgi:2-polyprenyl-3-methyl-5-hydroxy-6-metoxy-1,4-benzoquinol methylase|tara:strand:+ start:3543 stop:4766 length:1224 start_codon:yes stop_codon:yes gene_type:complete